MSLIKCPECGKDVSDMAKVCPSCGYNLKSNCIKFSIKKINTNKKITLLSIIIIILFCFLIIKNSSFDYSFKKYGKIGEYSKEVEKAYKDSNSKENLSSYSIYDDSNGDILYIKRNIIFLGKKGEISIHTNKEYIITQIDFVYLPQDNSLEWDFTEGKIYDDLYNDTKNYYNSALKKYSNKLGHDYNYLNYDLISEGVYWEKEEKRIELILCDYFRNAGVHMKPQVKITIREKD